MVLFLNVRKINSYSSLQELVDKSSPSVSIWGGRNLKVKGVRFPVSLDDVAYRLFSMVEKNIEFSEEDRGRGKIIVCKIDGFYKETEKSYLATRNPMKRVLYYIRNIFLLFLETEWHWSFGDKDFFELYTKTQYNNVFKKNPIEENRISQNPDLWNAPKE